MKTQKLAKDCGDCSYDVNNRNSTPASAITITPQLIPATLKFNPNESLYLQPMSHRANLDFDFLVRKQMNNDIPTLVETDWLAANLSSGEIRIIDATWYLPTVDRNGIENYNDGHIPGAVFWDIDAISDPNTQLPHMMPDEAIFEGHMRELGIGSEHHIIVYDNVKMMTAPRVWWTLRAFGHDKVSILNGGQKKWVAENRSLTKTSSCTHATNFIARLDTLMIRSIDEVRENLINNQEQLLDARTSRRFNGIDPEPRPGCRSGHIPKSLNLPFNQLIDEESGLFKSAEDLKSIFDAAGIDEASTIVTTCGSGITACVLALGLYLTGRYDVAVYDGSWTEWGGHEDTPVAS
ncbi:MAG: 3-mercaptopyruvate sulfurtransferase [Alphaproteobacteria bacterium MarineAlpha11_Bin1]|nr:MAG: 3-mercaptopyruvate sulfurtransferase [Alphaproteobacteria bacterium MarineAlpha11_Bin1]|tara:strand:+ start:12867 stop:13916 length:1050 start_codon:yes stop_codon:yes gene_type:complete